MPNDFLALFVHGVGQQGPHFADDARRNLRTALNARGIATWFETVHWAPLMDRLEAQFMADVVSRGSAGNASQKLTIGTAADALAYVSNAELRENIFSLVDAAAARFQGRHYCIFAHSLGALIATDHMRARARPAQLVTIGCNIGLFTLGRGFEHVPGLTSWLNLFDDDDALGWPVAGDPALSFVRDVQVNVGVTGLAHTHYWDHDRLWSETIPKLLFG